MEEKKMHNPIRQYAPGEKINPIINIMEQTPTQTIITKENIGHVSGNRLFTRVGGYELFVPLNDVIAINDQERTIIIFDEDDNSTTPANERQYLLLFEATDDSGIDESYWTFVYGRQDAFDMIVSLADVMDLHNSFILAETTKVKGAISMYSFLKMCIDKEVVNNPTGFDYSDYATEFIDDINEEG